MGREYEFKFTLYAAYVLFCSLASGVCGTRTVFNVVKSMTCRFSRRLGETVGCSGLRVESSDLQLTATLNIQSEGDVQHSHEEEGKVLAHLWLCVRFLDLELSPVNFGRLAVEISTSISCHE